MAEGALGYWKHFDLRRLVLHSSLSVVWNLDLASSKWWKTEGLLPRRAYETPSLRGYFKTTSYRSRSLPKWLKKKWNFRFFWRKTENPLLMGPKSGRNLWNLWSPLFLTSQKWQNGGKVASTFLGKWPWRKVAVFDEKWQKPLATFILTS